MSQSVGGIDFASLVLSPCLDAFGVPVTYQPADGAAFPLTVIFDEVFRAFEPTGNGGTFGVGSPSHITAAEPRAGVRLADFLVPPAQGDLLTLADGRQFWVQEVQSDGKGGAHLALNLQEGQM